MSYLKCLGIFFLIDLVRIYAIQTRKARVLRQTSLAEEKMKADHHRHQPPGREKPPIVSIL